MLAIVIPYFKLTFFRETLQSLSEQTDKRFKVYIGDDASPENPLFLLKEYAGKFDFEYKRFENNLGSKSLVKQWERCIEMIGDEEWIMVLGDDDVLGENVVEEFYNGLIVKPDAVVNVIRFATQSFEIEKNTKSKVYTHHELEKSSKSFIRKYSGLTRSSLSEYIFKRDRYTKKMFKNYPLAWHSDDYAWIEFAGDYPILSLNNALVTIRVSQQSITGNVANLKEKTIAESMFYMDLVKSQLHRFEKSERLNLLLQTELSIKKNRDIQLGEWFTLFGSYIRNYEAIVILKFIRRFCKDFFKK